MTVLGIDIGGSGIKGAPVDTSDGEFAEERFKVLTPQPATPEAVTACVAEVAQHFDVKGPVGVTFPGVVLSGVIHTAANLDPGWIGVNGSKDFGDAVGRPVTVLNDADAAGIAEMRFGAAAGQKGVVVLLTFGTGIGSAVFIDGKLLPNTEFGHIEIDGHDAEQRASAHAKELHDLSWGKWTGRVNDYLAHLEALLSPDLIVIGGGISRKSDKFLPHLKTRARVVPAQLHNDAGIVGAALAAEGA